VTTNSDRGVNSIDDCFHIFEAMEKNDIPLLIHGEVNDSDVDIFDREKIFIDRHLEKITKQFPNLRVVFEHISTKDAVEFVIDGSETLAATITPQHIMMNRNHLLSGGIKPHNYCLPVLKRSSHQKSVLEAALSGNPKFFLGTDSAPHLKNQKESACGCAGVYSAPYAMPMYAQIFEQNNALEKLEPFASFYGADFYKLPRNSAKLKLIKEKTQVSQSIKINDQEVIPYLAGCELDWQIVSN
jgi:dihydroorotase